MSTTVAVDKQTAPAAVDAPGATATEVPETEVPATEVMERELLVEDVSIDGMCGVY